MYRQYEDPYKLEQELKEAEAELEELDEKYAGKEEYWVHYIPAWERVIELKDRIRFAWADDEFDQYEY